MQKWKIAISICEKLEQCEAWQLSQLDVALRHASAPTAAGKQRRARKSIKKSQKIHSKKEPKCCAASAAAAALEMAKSLRIAL